MIIGIECEIHFSRKSELSNKSIVSPDDHTLGIKKIHGIRIRLPILTNDESNHNCDAHRTS